MISSLRRGIVTASLFLGTFLLALPPLAQATHSWGGYHWARTANPFTLKLGDNLTSAWDPYLATTSYDWSLSSVLDTTIVFGGRMPRRCQATSGMVQVCNYTYGNNGWLGIAQIWASGTHITAGTVKMNDTYFNKASYNTPEWRNLVMCQEVGHTLGLDHQDVDYYNPPLGTCMDYTSDPTPNQHPNFHDYEELEIIYSHLDTTTTIAAAPAAMYQIDFSSPDQWGRLISRSRDGRIAKYELDFGGGHKVFTFVIWAE